MAESVVISNIKENILEFDAEVKGIKDPKMSVNFVIKTEIVDLSFKAKHERDNTWSVVVPPLKMLEIGDTHPYMITVVVEGYHFEPMSGKVEVVGEIKASATRPAKQEKKAAAPKSEEKKIEPKEVKPEVEIKPEEKKVEVKSEEEEEGVKETKESATPLDQTIEKIINRETLRKSPSDIAIRKVLGEVKKPVAPVEPAVTAVPVETPEQISQRVAEEERLAEQAAREAAVKNILKGMSGTKATIRH